MDTTFYDTSWTLFYVSDSSDSYRNLVHVDQRSLDGWADKLRDHLGANRPRYMDEEEREKIGSLRDCKWASIGQAQHPPQTQGVSVSLTYDKATYRVLFCLNASSTDYPLLLIKAPAALTRRITAFLTETFAISIDALKLPASLLQRILQSHVAAIYKTFTSNPTNDVLALLRTSLGSLKLTISFAAPIAPHLRSLELDIPPETSKQLLAVPEEGFLPQLAHHIHNRTGLKIPVVGDAAATTTTISSIESTIDADDAVMRISKMSCAAFAISVEGRVKFAGKAVDAAGEYGDDVSNANKTLLGALLVEAERRGRSEG